MADASDPSVMIVKRQRSFDRRLLQLEQTNSELKERVLVLESGLHDERTLRLQHEYRVADLEYKVDRLLRAKEMTRDEYDQ